MSGSNDNKTDSTECLIIEQSPSSIIDFSSQYGSNNTHSYVVSNVCSRVEVYPSYGDSSHALVFRTYGPWWINMPSYKEIKKNFHRVENEFTSRDFIDIEYSNLVYECTSLHIYETYNPGSLENVYVGKENENGIITWHRVWKFPQPFSIILRNNQEYFIENGCQRMNDLFPNHVNTVTSALHSLHLNTDNEQISKIHTYHTYPAAARLPRIVKISLKNKVPFPTRHIRLEFDHSTVNYYLEIDTIFLCGQISKSSSLKSTTIIKKQEEGQTNEIQSHISLTKIPFDLLFLICSYLDLRSLIQLSSACRYLREQCLHPLQFSSLNLQPYWSGITNSSIEDFFLYHCVQTRYLSLAWSKSIEYSLLNKLLNKCSTNLIQLNLACCSYLTGENMMTIANDCPNIEILNLEKCMSLNKLDFIPLKHLHHIRSINVYQTKIDYRTLLPLIDNNKKHLENINLGACQDLIDTVGIVALLFARCSNLRSLDLWRARNLTQNDFWSIIGSQYYLGHEEFRVSNLSMEEHEEFRISNLSMEEHEELALVYSIVNMPVKIDSIIHMKYLTEIDFGWTDPPSGFIESLVKQAGNSLIKIFLTACRRISNEDIIAISENCLQLRQLDILGSNMIIETSIECILKYCLHLEFLDLSFCSKISDETISIWISKYKNCFKRSYSPLPGDDVSMEFA